MLFSEKMCPNEIDVWEVPFDILNRIISFCLTQQFLLQNTKLLLVASLFDFAILHTIFFNGFKVFFVPEHWISLATIVSENFGFFNFV